MRDLLQERMLVREKGSIYTERYAAIGEELKHM